MINDVFQRDSFKQKAVINIHKVNCKISTNFWLYFHTKKVYESVRTEFIKKLLEIFIAYFTYFHAF